ncbi:hypothetical protein EDC96DRAFT_154289 [Choanephora cucurbitarum]|nr:hypothetical protein EDC96DRAFT_35413 [Choanephora cucurbitarum]KAI8367127.1 hypothetical protein EDC96DRAFT_154289 [Choanephora cucurbitarum]
MLWLQTMSSIYILNIPNAVLFHTQNLCILYALIAFNLFLSLLLYLLSQTTFRLTYFIVALNTSMILLIPLC